MKVVWTESALRHLTAIYEFIATDSPTYATRVVDRITRRSEQIGQHPQSGGRVAEFDDPAIRELIERPYRVIYRIKADRAEIVAVIHGSRRLPPLSE